MQVCHSETPHQSTQTCNPTRRPPRTHSHHNTSSFLPTDELQHIGQRKAATSDGENIIKKKPGVVPLGVRGFKSSLTNEQSFRSSKPSTWTTSCYYCPPGISFTTPARPAPAPSPDPTPPEIAYVPERHVCLRNRNCL